MAENNNTNNKQQSVPEGTAVDTDKTAAKEATAAGEAAENANKKAMRKLNCFVPHGLNFYCFAFS